MRIRLHKCLVALPLAVWLGLLPVPSFLPPAAAAAPAAAPTKAAEPIPWSELGTRATAQYTGDGLSISPAEGGAVLRCVFQRLEAEATSEGLWLASTVPEAAKDRFRVKAVAVGRGSVWRAPACAGRPDSSALWAGGGENVYDGLPGDPWESGAQAHALQTLARIGDVSVEGQTVRFLRPGLIEEYSVGMDGVRQDFVVTERPELSLVGSSRRDDRTARRAVATGPASEGKLRVELEVTGARVEAAAHGARLVLEHSGRKIAYSRLRVTDATGRELRARLEVVDDRPERDLVSRASVWSAPDLSALWAGRGEEADGGLLRGVWESGAEAHALQTLARGPDDLVDTPAKGSRHAPPALAVLVDDADAVYPVRIDPTFSDENWISMGGPPGVAGQVLAAAVDASGNLYIGGRFSGVGDVTAKGIAKWDGSSWSALGSGVGGDFPIVNALAVLGGDLYAGGWFRTAGGGSANAIAKWDGNSWSALESGMSGWPNPAVRALAVLGNDLYAGGEFTAAGGIVASNIAKWNGSSWSALGSGVMGPPKIIFVTPEDSTVRALAVSGSDLYVGGEFTTAGGIAATNIAKWDGSTWAALGSGMNSNVYALAVSVGELYAGGYFTNAGGVAATNIAKWNGSSWSALGSGINSTVYALAVSGSELYAGGYFTNAGGVAATNIARWNGSSWSALGSGLNGSVAALAVLGNDLYAEGAGRIARWNGSSWSSVVAGSGINGRVYALAVSGSDVYAGGLFTTAGGNPATYIAKWDGSSWSALGSGMNNWVLALAVSGSDLYAGGGFTTAGGVTAYGVAKWDGNSWSALGSGFQGYVYALAVSGTDVYAGGAFSTTGGNWTNSIAKWNGTTWSTLGEGMDKRIRALVASGSEVYAGGSFTNAGGTPANYVAKWNGASWSAVGSGLPYGLDHYYGVYALAVWGSDLYAGGWFTTAGGTQPDFIAKLNGSSWSGLGSGIKSPVFALAVSGNDLYAGGVFTAAGGSPAKNIAKWNGSTWAALGSGVSWSVHALAVSGSDLYVGGDFSTAGGKISSYVAKALLGEPAVVDLAIQNASFTPASLSAGQNLNVSFRVRNVGSVASPPSNARVQLTADAVLTSSDPGVVPVQVGIPGLNPGAFYDLTGTFTVPASILPGMYYVGATVDPSRVLNEISRANNVALSASKLTVQGTGGPSLLVAPANRDVASAPGITGIIIQNIGGGAFSWTASITDAPWLQFASSSSGTSVPLGSTVIMRFDANPTTSPRTGHVLVSAPGATPASQTVTVTQAGAAPPGPAVTHFAFSPIASPQTRNVLFVVTIQAMNGGAVQTAFNGRATLSSDAGGNVSLRYVDFSNGQWAGQLSLDTPSPNTRLIAVGKYGTTAEGQSNPFAVQAAGSDVKVTVKVTAQTGGVVSGATVSLQRTGEFPVTRTSDAQGLAEFTTAGAEKNYRLRVEKTGYFVYAESVDIPATPRTFEVQLQPLGKPPVVFVPAMMGSCDRVEWDLFRLGLPLAYPLLPRWFADPEELKLFDPGVGRITDSGTLILYYEAVGWIKLWKELSEHYSVFPAPWDWRIPPVTGGGYINAWQKYLIPVIDKAKERTGHAKVDVVAHSMGGLVTRAYIEGPGYRDDIGKFAMVGTPNEGSAKAYYLWFLADPSIEDIYEGTSQYNYERWNAPRRWKRATTSDRFSFYQGQIPALEQLLPVYPYALGIDVSPELSYVQPFPGRTDNALYVLNQGTFDRYDPAGAAGKVWAKVFYSYEEQTLATIRLYPHSQAPNYPHGRPKGKVYGLGDGTVLHTSAWMQSSGNPFPSEGFPYGGDHKGLIGKLSTQISKFLTGQQVQRPARGESDGPSPAWSDSASNHLAVSVLGRGRLWVVDPQLAEAGTSPLTDAYTNGWPGSVVELGPNGSTVLRSDAPDGLYQGSVKGFTGEMLSLGVQLFQTNGTSLTNVSWIVSTNDITFAFQLDSGSNLIRLILAVLAPTNVTSFSSNGTCHVSWADASGGVAPAYRIYGRREDGSLFRLLGTTTNLNYNTGYQWETGNTGTNWFFAVVAVTTNQVESPYTDVVMNATPTRAVFTADVLSGAPPLTVSFTDQSRGTITNWAWDFDSDGTIDSAEINPIATYAEPGEYSVTLSVAGPDGADTKVAVGYITVTRLAFRGARVLPDQTVEFEVEAQAGHEYLIQCSTNLVNWATLETFLATNSVSIFRDTNAPSFGKRFYRIAIP